MQWIIDILWDMLIARGIFVDRGDPPAWDFAKPDFTTDSAWHDLDLSGIVPENARGVVLHLAINSGLIGSFAQFRKNSTTTPFSRSELRIQTGGLFNDADIVVSLDADRFIEYKISNVLWTNIYLGVKGWWY